MDTIHPLIVPAARKSRKKSTYPDIVVLHDVVYPDSDKDELFNIELAMEIAGLLSDVYPHVEALPYRKKTLDYLSRRKESCDNFIVFNLVENVQRRSEWIYRVPKSLEERGIAYTGCSAAAIRGTDTNKILAKKIMANAVLPTPDSYTIRELEKLPLVKERYIVKSAWYHGSYGIREDSVSGDRDTLLNLLHDRQKEYGGEWYAEKFIEGREFYMGMLGRKDSLPKLLPLGEVVFSKNNRILSYEAKWDENGVQFVNDVHLKNRTLQKKLENIAGQCWLLFGLNGYGRIDFRVDEDDNPYILEVNTNPYIGLGDSPLLRAASCQGYTPLDILMHLIECAHKPAQ